MPPKWADEKLLSLWQSTRWLDLRRRHAHPGASFHAAGAPTQSHCCPKTPTWRPPLQPRPLLCASREISQPLPAHAIGSGTKTELQLSEEAQGCMLMLLLQGDPGYQVLSTSITIGPFFVPPQTHKQEHLWQKEFRCWEDSRKDRISFDPHNSSRHGHYCPKIRIEEIPYPR